jgi:hypothetical protein
MYPPGTAEKVEIMRWRLAKGFHLHHPDDAGWGDERPESGES